MTLNNQRGHDHAYVISIEVAGHLETCSKGGLKLVMLLTHTHTHADVHIQARTPVRHTCYTPHPIDTGPQV